MHNTFSPRRWEVKAASIWKIGTELKKKARKVRTEENKRTQRDEELRSLGLG
jgi:hypothetical protein